MKVSLVSACYGLLNCVLSSPSVLGPLIQENVLLQDALNTIYSTILSQHLQFGSFPISTQKAAATLTQAALALHARVSSAFLPTAVKFHYVFNLRDLSNVFQVCIVDKSNYANVFLLSLQNGCLKYLSVTVP